MKILFLITHTPNCEPFWRSLEAIGHEVKTLQYDSYSHDRAGGLESDARAIEPDAIIYIGAYAPSHDRPVPTVDTLCRIRDIGASFILLCGDAADDPWWPVLEEYHSKRCFDVMVAIDGSYDTPIAGFQEGLTLLTPLDPRVYNPLPWDQRTIRFGMIGGMGHRGQMITELQAKGLDYRSGPVGRSYADFAQLLCNTRLTLNLAQTGTGAHMHVKGRVVEAGFAGSAVLEFRNSPLNRWFLPGIDYMEYSNAAEVVHQVQDMGDIELRNMAHRFHTKMVRDHNPADFWAKVFAKCQLYW